MPGQTIYLDNAATSFPKAPGVPDAVFSYLSNVGVNVNRGSYHQALEAAEVVFETRELICRLFNAPNPEYVVFTKNITESLNTLIIGLLRPGDHVLLSSIEHNAVLRPLNHLKERHKGRLELDILPCNPEGSLPAGHELENLLTSKLKSNTKAIILTHASNVCGTILPLREIGSFCRKHNLFFLIDSAQTAGSVPVDFLEIEADALAFTGHKGLLGPQGIGGIVLNTRIASQIEPLITGGTGSSSEDEFQPSFMPDRFEAGTLNIPGIYGLHAALTYLNKVGVTRIREIESTLTKRFIQGIVPLKGVNLIGLPTAYGRTSVISLDFPLKDNAIVSHHLASVHGIINRCGLHCAPLAHKTLGTYPQGTVRLSFGFANTTEEVDIVLEVIEQYIKH